MMRFIFPLLLLLAACSHPPQDIRLASLFTDHMVLQQQTEVSIWGWANPGERVSLSGNWDNEIASGKADAKGYWLIKIQTPEAGGPYTLTIHGQEPIVLEDVMIGEVWLASGQSNMEWPMKQAKLGQAAIDEAHYPDIRLFMVEKSASDQPEEDCQGSWKVCDPTSVADFSAVAYHFGRDLNSQLGVPIGIIGSYWGGTPAEAWTSPAGLSEDPEVHVLLDRFESAQAAYQADSNLSNPVQAVAATCLYNAMIHPLLQYPIKGVIWYQGEANVTDPYLYRKLFPAMIRDWRKGWGYEFPFYFVQLAPFQYEVPYSGAGVREAQMMTLNVPHTGMAVTLDVGNPTDIHPTDKQTVGKRLAQIALARTYQQEGIVASGPLYESMASRGQEVKLFFAHTADLLIAKGGPLTHFRIAGVDRVFHNADARIVDDTTIIVSSPSVGNPRAVRYAFSDTAQPNLFNQAGLPAASFRTDDWPIFFVLPKIFAEYQADKNEFLVNMQIGGQAKELRYTLDGSDPNRFSSLYSEPLRIRRPTTIKVRVFQGGFPSEAIVEKKLLRHEAMNAEISLKEMPNAQYLGGRERGLADGITASIAFMDPSWQGYHGKTFEVTLDMGQELTLSEISVRFLEDPPVWIFFPKKITFLTSLDGQTFEELGNKMPVTAAPQTTRSIGEFKQSLTGKAHRYLKIVAENFGPCPEWHMGAGGTTWIFVDEVIVR